MNIAFFRIPSGRNGAILEQRAPFCERLVWQQARKQCSRYSPIESH
jgi:hypothetical protein